MAEEPSLRPTNVDEPLTNSTHQSKDRHQFGAEFPYPEQTLSCESGASSPGKGKTPAVWDHTHAFHFSTVSSGVTVTDAGVAAAGYDQKYFVNGFAIWKAATSELWIRDAAAFGLGNWRKVVLVP